MYDATITLWLLIKKKYLIWTQGVTEMVHKVKGNIAGDIILATTVENKHEFAILGVDLQNK